MYSLIHKRSRKVKIDKNDDNLAYLGYNNAIIYTKPIDYNNDTVIRFIIFKKLTLSIGTIDLKTGYYSIIYIFEEYYKKNNKYKLIYSHTDNMIYIYRNNICVYENILLGRKINSRHFYFKLSCLGTVNFTRDFKIKFFGGISNYISLIIRMRNLILSNRAIIKSKEITPIIWICKYVPFWILQQVCYFMKKLK